MLAQNFKTPADLRLTDMEFESLVKVLGMLERGELRHDPKRMLTGERFNMGVWRWNDGCGSIACICGWAYFISKGAAFPELQYFSSRPERNEPLEDLFVPVKHPDAGVANKRMLQITTAQAAIALRNYLTHGEARWDEALGPRG